MSLNDNKIEILKNKPEYTIRAFFQQFERATKSINYNNIQKVTALPIFMADSPRRWFEAEWKINQNRSYDQWKQILFKKYMSEEYKQNKRFELSQKVLRIGVNVNKFFDEMQTFFQEIDPLMLETTK